MLYPQIKLYFQHSLRAEANKDILGKSKSLGHGAPSTTGTGRMASDILPCLEFVSVILYRVRHTPRVRGIKLKFYFSIQIRGHCHEKDPLKHTGI
jgi:hypothetical protein